MKQETDQDRKVAPTDGTWTFEGRRWSYRDRRRTEPSRSFEMVGSSRVRPTLWIDERGMLYVGNGRPSGFRPCRGLA